MIMVIMVVMAMVILLKAQVCLSFLLFFFLFSPFCYDYSCSNIGKERYGLLQTLMEYDDSFFATGDTYIDQVQVVNAPVIYINGFDWPMPRHNAIVWGDSNGNLWLFGGIVRMSTCSSPGIITNIIILHYY